MAKPDPTRDATVRRWLSPVTELVDPEARDGGEDVAEHFRRREIAVAVPQIATDFCRHLDFFTPLLDRLRERSVRIVATVHNVLPHDVFPVDRAALAALYQRFDAFLVGNAAQEALLREHFAPGPRPVRIAPQGPYVRLARGAHDRASARALLGLPAQGPGVLFFGGLRPNKGLDLLLESWPRVRASRPDAWLYVSIDASLVQPWDRQTRLTTVARQTDLPGVYLRPERIPAAWIEPTFLACDLVALPYRSVSQSGLANVARAFRRPMVASEAFARAERLGPDEGRVVAGGPDALARGILATLRELPRPPVPDEAPWDRHAEVLREVLAAVLAPSRPRATPPCATSPYATSR